jgi:hypothetical protein
MPEYFRLDQSVYAKRARCWLRASVSRINGDSTFGVTFQDEALVDLIDDHTPPYLGKDRKSAIVTVTDGSEEAESDCDDESDDDAEGNDWVCAPRHSKNRNTTNCWKFFSKWVR